MTMMITMIALLMVLGPARPGWCGHGPWATAAHRRCYRGKWSRLHPAAAWTRLSMRSAHQPRLSSPSLVTHSCLVPRASSGCLRTTTCCCIKTASILPSSYFLTSWYPPAQTSHAATDQGMGHTASLMSERHKETATGDTGQGGSPYCHISLCHEVTKSRKLREEKEAFYVAGY